MKTDETLRASTPNGTPEFPFESYYDELEKFKGHCVTWHWHNEFEFSVASDSRVRCQIGSDVLVLEQGDGLFINSGVLHRFASGEGGILKDILFAPDLFAPHSSAVFRKYILPVSGSQLRYFLLHRADQAHRPLLDKFDELYNNAQRDDPMRELRLQRMTTELWERFYPLVQNAAAEQETKSDRMVRARMHRMIDFIQTEYRRALPLDEIAAAASVSKSEALRCFRQSIRMTPGQYLTEYRLERAKEHLLSGRETVSSIAENTGFRSAGYFCRVFKAHIGVTPEMFRSGALEISGDIV